MGSVLQFLVGSGLLIGSVFGGVRVGSVFCVVCIALVLFVFVLCLVPIIRFFGFFILDCASGFF